jgi:hypothetical protein
MKKVFWFTRKKKSHSSADIDQLFERLSRLLIDENLQNERLPPELKEEIRRSRPTDIVPAAWGEFGRDLNNPIPTNGPIGEILYLSSLKSDGGARIAFQRLGSVGKVDVFETISFDGKDWSILCCSMYYPRKSRIAPKGFMFVGNEYGSRWIRGTNNYAIEFPRGILQRTIEWTETRIGLTIADPDLKLFDTGTWNRPPQHLVALEQFRFGGRIEVSGPPKSPPA